MPDAEEMQEGFESATSDDCSRELVLSHQIQSLIE
jgi:hypothetical protein